jgi:hypothetical protein
VHFGILNLSGEWSDYERSEFELMVAPAVNVALKIINSLADSIDTIEKLSGKLLTQSDVEIAKRISY